MSNHGITYDESDILRYLEGKMTTAEMHRFEVAALDDPFLQDAIDGYSSTRDAGETEKISATINELKSFKPKNGAKKYRNVIISVWQKNIMEYAVAALLVGAAGWFVFNVSNYKQGVTTARQEVPSPAKTDSLPTTPALTPTPQPGVVAKNDKASAETLAIAKNQSAIKKEKVPVAATNEVNKVEPTAGVATASAKADAPSATPGKTLSGKVTDIDNFPLDNISIRVKGSEGETVTDELGRFDLKVSDTNHTIIASAPGYKTREVPAIKSKSRLELKLERSAMPLDEMVVGGLSKKDLQSTDVDTSEAIPQGGWKNFVAYVQKETIKNGKSIFKQDQPVVISFEIDRKGRPSEFDIIQSAGKLLDDEAIHLLQNGPAWINKTKNPSPLVKLSIPL